MFIDIGIGSHAQAAVRDFEGSHGVLVVGDVRAHVVAQFVPLIHLETRIRGTDERARTRNAGGGVVVHQCECGCGYESPAAGRLSTGRTTTNSDLLRPLHGLAILPFAVELGRLLKYGAREGSQTIPVACKGGPERSRRQRK